eukprot:gb/GEZN01011267.1/.p1 GENE.gb/GEZN01011267.1/~~gb/GEZN01011267.1/.p1  ORF type:complete len:321 (+),score=58.71 gb/GEZN01011267.1/:78-1040(+)
MSANAEPVSGDNLLRVAETGDANEVIRELAAGAPVNAQEAQFGKTPLILASINGHTRIVKILLGAKADIDAKNNEGDTALMWAAYNGHYDITKMLIGAKADIHAQNLKGKNALWQARLNDQTEIIELLESLIKKDAPISHDSKSHKAFTPTLEKSKTDPRQAMANMMKEVKKTVTHYEHDKAEWKQNLYGDFRKEHVSKDFHEAANEVALAVAATIVTQTGNTCFATFVRGMAKELANAAADTVTDHKISFDPDVDSYLLVSLTKEHIRQKKCLGSLTHKVVLAGKTRILEPGNERAKSLCQKLCDKLDTQVLKQLIHEL